MKIYIVEAGWHYEGFENLKAFDTEEKANEFVQEVRAAKDSRYDFVDIEEMDVC